MKPELVKPGNFELVEIVYNNGEFSIAYGRFYGGEMCIAVRWNGEDDADAGYPKTFGNPMWMIVHNDLKIPFLKSIFGNEFSKNDIILKIFTGEI